jgi:hypothetical protein
MKQLESNRSGSAGFTLLELMIAGVFLVVMIGAFHAAVTRGAGTYRASVGPAALESRAIRLAARIAELIAETGMGELDPLPLGPVGGTSVEFRQNTGYDGGVVWGPKMRVQLEYEDGELDDGLDNNGNGLVDEGRVVLVQDVGGPDEARRMLIGGVAEFLEGETLNAADDNGNGLIDERGFVLVLNGTTLTIQVTLEGIDQSGATISRTVGTSVKIRN